MRAMILLTLTSVLVGCGDDGGGEGTGGAGGTGGSGGAPSTPTFADVHAQVVTPLSCGSGPACHGPIPSPPPGAFPITNDAAATYAALIDQPAAGTGCGTSGLVRVVPGEPDQSLLYLKLAGSPPCGDEMPIGLPTDAEKVDLVRRWIEGGALEQ